MNRAALVINVARFVIHVCLRVLPDTSNRRESIRRATFFVCGAGGLGGADKRIDG